MPQIILLDVQARRRKGAVLYVIKIKNPKYKLKYSFIAYVLKHLKKLVSVDFYKEMHQSLGLLHVHSKIYA